MSDEPLNHTAARRWGLTAITVLGLLMLRFVYGAWEEWTSLRATIEAQDLVDRMSQLKPSVLKFDWLRIYLLGFGSLLLSLLIWLSHRALRDLPRKRPPGGTETV